MKRRGYENEIRRTDALKGTEEKGIITGVFLEGLIKSKSNFMKLCSFPPEFVLRIFEFFTDQKYHQSEVNVTRNLC
jgi:hypothetical protein